MRSIADQSLDRDMRMFKTLFILLLSMPSLAAVDSHQFSTVKALGDLNAVALHCGYLDQTRRIKAALVAHLPKRRELGFAFDEQTHQAFLKFIEQGAGCPAQARFADDVGTAIDAMQRAFDGEHRE